MNKKRAKPSRQQRLQEEILQRYLDRMTAFILDPHFHDRAAGEQLRNLARAHTLTTVARLDPLRKGVAVQFLYEGGLIGGDPSSSSAPLIPLRHANLKGIQLPHTNLGWSQMVAADLSEADLRGAFLSCANLGGVDLIDADLSGATLTGANLVLADIRGCNFQDADLTDVLITVEQLRLVKNTTRAILPGHITLLDLEQ